AQQRAGHCRAIVAPAADLHLIPTRKRGIVVAVEQKAYAACEAASLSLEHVAETLPQTPLAGGRMPAGERIGQRLGLGRDRSHRGLKQPRDFGPGKPVLMCAHGVRYLAVSPSA